MKKTDWEPKLKEHHNTFWKQAWKRLSRKLSVLKSNITSRSNSAGVACDVTLDELKELCFIAYGTPCKYCQRTLTYHNMACDHIIPIVKGGSSTKENLQFICKTCNTRKGPLDEDHFLQLLDWVNIQTIELKEYVMRKLAKGGKW